MSPFAFQLSLYEETRADDEVRPRKSGTTIVYADSARRNCLLYGPNPLEVVTFERCIERIY